MFEYISIWVVDLSVQDANEVTEATELKESPESSPARRPAGPEPGALYVRMIEPPLPGESERQSISSLMTGVSESDSLSDPCALRSELRPLVAVAPPAGGGGDSSSSASESESDTSDEQDDEGPLAVTTSAAFARYAAPAPVCLSVAARLPPAQQQTPAAFEQHHSTQRLLIAAQSGEAEKFASAAPALSPQAPIPNAATGTLSGSIASSKASEHSTREVLTSSPTSDEVRFSFSNNMDFAWIFCICSSETKLLVRILTNLHVLCENCSCRLVQLGRWTLRMYQLYFRHR